MGTRFPKNLEAALEALSKSIDNLGIFKNSEKRGHYLEVQDDKAFYDLFETLIFDTPEISIWNVTQVEQNNGITKHDDPARKVKFGFVGRGIHTAEDNDFIDLDALTRNAFSML